MRIVDVPFDVFLLILRHLAVPDIVTLQRTCKQIRELLLEHALWAEVNRSCFDFPRIHVLTMQDESSEMLRLRALQMYRLRLHWTTLGRTFVPAISDPTLCSASLLSGSACFVAAFTDGRLNVYGFGDPIPRYTARQPTASGISSKVHVVQTEGVEYVIWAIPGASIHQTNIYVRASDTLHYITTITTPLLVQRFSLRGNILAIAGYAIREEHRVYVQVIRFAAGSTSLLFKIALDDAIDLFGELLGLSLLDESNVLLCHRRGLCVYTLSAIPLGGTILSPTWHQDVSDWYSNTSDCAIGEPIHIQDSITNMTMSACSIVTGDRFFLFGRSVQHDSPHHIRYFVRPLDVFEGVSASTSRAETRAEAIPFRDRSAKLMTCTSNLAVWLSPGREQVMTASLSPLSVFLESSGSASQPPTNGEAGMTAKSSILQHHDAIGSYGFDTVLGDQEITIGGLELPNRLRMNAVEQISLDDVVGNVGILTKDEMLGPGTGTTFLVAAPILSP